MLARMRSAGPRRRLGAGLLLLALWLQALAPAAALRAAALADPLAHAVICGHDGGVVDLAAGAPAPAAPACDHCPFCRCTAAAPVPAAPAPADRRLVWHPVAWPMPPPARTHRPPRCTRLARAPPRTV